MSALGRNQTFALSYITGFVLAVLAGSAGRDRNAKVTKWRKWMRQGTARAMRSPFSLVRRPLRACALF